MSGNRDFVAVSGDARQAADQRCTVNIRPLQEADVSRAVDIHIKAIPYSINALLGKSHLADLYRAFIRAEGVCALVAVDDSGRIVGVVTGVSDPQTILRAMGRLKLFVTLPIRALAHPKAVLEMVLSIFIKAARHPPGVRAMLTTIAVAAESRGKGIGADLVKALEACFNRWGIREYWLETRSNNSAAYKFYKTLDFTEFSRGTRDIGFTKRLPAREQLRS